MDSEVGIPTGTELLREKEKRTNIICFFFSITVFLQYTHPQFKIYISGKSVCSYV